MREIHGFRVRGLTRKEVRDMKKYGFYHSFYAPPMGDPELIDEGLEKALRLCVPDLPDEVPNRVMVDLFKRGVFPETYGSEDEEKNSQGSGNGSQTQKG